MYNNCKKCKIELPSTMIAALTKDALVGSPLSKLPDISSNTLGPNTIGVGCNWNSLIKHKTKMIAS